MQQRRSEPRVVSGGVVVFVVRHWLSPVRCGRDGPSAHVELAEWDERPGQEAVRERWREDEERSSSERDRDRRRWCADSARWASSGRHVDHRDRRRGMISM